MMENRMLLVYFLEMVYHSQTLSTIEEISSEEFHNKNWEIVDPRDTARYLAVTKLGLDVHNLDPKPSLKFLRRHIICAKFSDLVRSSDFNALRELIFEKSCC
jgi:hypothetical protein